MMRPFIRPASKATAPFDAVHPKRTRVWLSSDTCGARFTLMIILLLLWSRLSLQQGDPVSGFCRRFGHQAAIVDDRLYIDGGFIDYNPLEQYSENYTNTYFSFHDISTVAGSGMPQLYSNLSKNDTIPSVHGGVLWPDTINKRVYQFGGEFQGGKRPPPLDGLNAYDILSDQWDHFGSGSNGTHGPGTAVLHRTSYGAGVSISERGEGYWYGGWISGRTEDGWGPGREATSYLVKYEMDQNRWTNSSGPDDVGRAEGVMVYLPAGDAGLLVYFGGLRDEHGNGTAEAQPLDEIFVYDVLSFKWYKQSASGDVPGNRSRFCAGVTWAEDRSSYNIYIYGGASMPPSTAGYDDVYILSLPSFTWIKVYPDGRGTGEFPHHSLTCSVTPSRSQMLIIGGTFPLSDMCDTPDQWGVHNMDMGRQNPDKALWMLYDPHKGDYVVPSNISDEIGGGEHGGATKTEPRGGFDSADLGVLLSRTASSAAREPTREIPGTGGKGLSGGAIAGIVVGSVVAAVAVLFAVVCLLRRHRRRKTPQPGPETAAVSETSDYVPPAPQAGPAELAAEQPATPAGFALTPDSERGKDWGREMSRAVSPGGASGDGAHELSAASGVRRPSLGTEGRVHATYYHA